MSAKPLKLREWAEFEPMRIVSMGLKVTEEHRADYIRVQIEAAIWKAFLHDRDGLTPDDLVRHGPPRS